MSQRCRSGRSRGVTCVCVCVTLCVYRGGGEVQGSEVCIHVCVCMRGRGREGRMHAGVVRGVWVLCVMVVQAVLCQTTCCQALEGMQE